MTIRELIFLLSGIFIAFLILYLLILRTFIKYMENEKEHNEIYRFNATASYDKSKQDLNDNYDADNIKDNDDNFSNW